MHERSRPMLGSPALSPHSHEGPCSGVPHCLRGPLGPHEGTLDWMIADAMNAGLTGMFLRQAGEAHLIQEVVMVLDGASPHRASGLVVPDKLQLVCLPPCSPELNPTEILWHELREKFCANRAFDTLDAVIDQVKKGLERFSMNPESVSRLSGGSWIVNSILLNAK